MKPLKQLAKEKLLKKKVIAVMSAKGGVGKSLIASLLSLTLSENENTTLIDLDIHGMASTKLFGLEGRLHEVTKDGIEPFVIGKLGVISLSGIVKDKYVILPGGGESSVMESLIAFSNLGNSSTIVFDLPPGLGDEVLVLDSVASHYTPVVVTTPSKISVKVVEYLLRYLKTERGKDPILIVNMAYYNCENEVIRPFGDINVVKELVRRYDVRRVVEIPIDPNVEDYVGKIQEYRGEIKEKIKNIFNF